MSVTSMMVGATTPDGATFVAKVTGGGPVRVAVSTDAGMTSPVFTGSQAVDAQGVAKVAIAGLAADTRHFWQVEDNAVLDTSLTGQFLTHPPLGQPGSFTVGIVADSGLEPVTPGVGAVLAPERLSNHAILDTIRQRALAEDWHMVHWLGDDLYYDYGSGVWVPDATIGTYRRGRDDRLLQPRAHQLDREVANTRQKDDHDGAQNNHDSTDPGTRVYNQVYREREPHYPLPDAAPDGGIYWSRQICRTLIIGADVRTFKNETAGAMLGAAQLAWMDDLLANTTAKFVLWLMPGQWMGVDADTWASHPDEQAAVVAMFTARGFGGRVAIVGADAHILALDTGASSPGGIPVLQAAPIDATPGFGDITDYDLGGRVGREQYGTVTVQDLGSHLVVTLTGWHQSSEVVSYRLTVAGDPPPPLASGALLRIISGSHRMLVEARVVTTFQAGPDPEGVPIDILGGDVQLDGTARIRGTLALTTDGNGAWPRRGADLLAPFGNEIFVRRGVDTGPDSEPVWVPLGYFRIQDTEQDDAPDGPIRLAGRDRMAGIVDARLLAPRSYQPEETYAAVVADLVGEIYPDVAVLFDDDLGQTPIGRLYLVEEDRYQGLRDLAESRGKVVFFDGEGFLRIQAAPDASVPVWEVSAGDGGVLIEAGRHLTREGVFNAVVALGEASDDQEPARAVVVDKGPNSATRFGGRFGRVPMFYSSPLLTNQDQATTAALAILRRNLGFPYSVDFSAVPNPALRPGDPITIDTGDRREVHVIERVTIPLTEGAALTANTAEKTLIAVSPL